MKNKQYVKGFLREPSFLPLLADKKEKTPFSPGRELCSRSLRELRGTSCGRQETRQTLK